MILINGKTRTNDELIATFGLPGDKIKKNCEFWINEELKGFDLGSRKKRNTLPRKFPASFTAEDKEGNTIEVRYAQRKSQVRDKVTRQLIDIYSPKKVQTNGDITMCDKLDIAIFLYLHPKHKNSPFRNQGETIWTYAFHDKTAAATAEIAKGDVMRQALNHAAEASGKDLKIMAKGLGITAVDEMDLQEIRAALTSKAMSDPAGYIQKVGKQGTKMEGRILDAIDKNMVKLDESYGTPKWLWNGGPNRGQLICEVTNLSITPRQFLINFVKANLDRFYSDIVAIQETADADEVAEAFLSKQNQAPVVYVEDLEDENEDKDETFEFFQSEDKDVVSTEDFPEAEDIVDDDDVEPLPHDFKSSQAFILKARGKNASPKQAKQLWDAVEDGTVTHKNVGAWIKENIGE